MNRCCQCPLLAIMFSSLVQQPVVWPLPVVRTGDQITLSPWDLWNQTRHSWNQQFSWSLEKGTARGAFLEAQMVKKLPAVQETWVWTLGWEDPLEEGMATHSVFLPGESPWTEEPDGLQSMELQRVRHDWATKHRAAVWSHGKLFVRAGYWQGRAMSITQTQSPEHLKALGEPGSPSRDEILKGG